MEDYKAVGSLQLAVRMWQVAGCSMKQQEGVNSIKTQQQFTVGTIQHVVNTTRGHWKKSGRAFLGLPEF